MIKASLDPYVAVDGTPFSASSDAIVQSRGRPWKSGRNALGLDELDYGDKVYRFQDGGRLEEITFQAEVITLGKVALPFAALASFLRSQDEEAFERAGFLVSPAFGLAFDPREPYWITALARHCIAEWQAL